MAKDKLKILNMNGATIEAIFFRNQVGIGSCSHCLFGSFWITKSNSSNVISSKPFKLKFSLHFENSGASDDWIAVSIFQSPRFFTRIYAVSLKCFSYLKKLCVSIKFISVFEYTTFKHPQ